MLKNRIICLAVVFIACANCLGAMASVVPDNALLREDIARQVNQLLLAGRATPADMPQVSLAMQAISQAIAAPVMAGLDSGDIEVRQRCRSLLAEMDRQCRLALAQQYLSPPMQRKCRQFAAENPSLSDRLLSAELDVAQKAYLDLSSMADPQGLAEPMIIVALLGKHFELVKPAWQALANERYRSEELAQAIVHCLLLSDNKNFDVLTRANLAAQLASMRSRKAAAMIVSILSDPHRAGLLIRDTLPADMLAGCAQLGAVPTLMAGLPVAGDATIRLPAATTAIDLKLYAILLLSGQSPEDYGMAVQPTVFFRDRKHAVEKLRAWWQEAQRKEPYASVQPLELPNLEDILRRHEMLVEPLPAGGNLTAAPEPIHIDTLRFPTQVETLGPPPQLADHQELIGEITLAIHRLMMEFAGPRASRRDSAHSAILGIHEAYLQALVEQASGTNLTAAGGARRGLAGEAVSSRINAHLAELPAEQRAKLQQFRRLHADVIQQAFSSDVRTRIEGMKRLGGIADPQRLAEPLVIMCLTAREPGLVMASAKIASGGNYRSPETIQALHQVLMAQMPKGNLRPSIPSPGWAALDALLAIGDQSTPPLLLSLMLSKSNPSWPTNAVLADALIKLDAKGAIPRLVEGLEGGATPRFKGVIGQKPFTWAASDSMLQALLGLTGQKAEDYNLKEADIGGVKVKGFAEPSDRQKAIKAFLDWWQKHKEESPYKGLKSLELVPVPIMGVDAQ